MLQNRAYAGISFMHFYGSVHLKDESKKLRVILKNAKNLENSDNLIMSRYPTLKILPVWKPQVQQELPRHIPSRLKSQITKIHFIPIPSPQFKHTTNLPLNNPAQPHKLAHHLLSTPWISQKRSKPSIPRQIHRSTNQTL